MIKLIIVDSNTSYMKAFSNYLQGEFGHLFEVTCFTTKQGLHQHLGLLTAVDILLIDNSLCDTRNGFDKAKVIVMMTENAHESDTTAIYKYQNVENIAKHILRIYDNASIGIIHNHQMHISSKLICVYSSSGGAGKTTVAHNLAVQYAMQQKKVLFVSLETYCDLSQLCRDDGAKGVIYLLYLLKNQPTNLRLKLDNLKAVDIITRVNYIPRESNALEYKDITIEDIILLTDFLRKQSGYDAVIFDLDSTINETVLGMAKCCDVIVNVVCSEIGMDKQLDFMRQVPKISDLLKQDISKKILHVINKHNELRDSEGNNYEEFKIHLKIPYLNNCHAFQQAYFPEMSSFKELYDILDNFCFEEGLNAR